MTGYATDGQLSYLEDALSANALYDGHYDRLWKILEAARIDMRRRGDGAPLSARQAAEIRVWLDRQIAGLHAVTPLRRQIPGCRHRADRNGNCVTCGAEMPGPSLRGAR